MPLQLSPELEQRVIDLATATRRDPNEVFAELVCDALDDIDIAISDAGFERGEGIPHEQVVQEMQAIIDSARRDQRDPTAAELARRIALGEADIARGAGIPLEQVMRDARAIVDGKNAPALEDRITNEPSERVEKLDD